MCQWHKFVTDTQLSRARPKLECNFPALAGASNNNMIWQEGSKFEFFVSIQVDTSNIKSGIHLWNMISRTSMLNYFSSQYLTRQNIFRWKTIIILPTPPVITSFCIYFNIQLDWIWILSGRVKSVKSCKSCKSRARKVEELCIRVPIEKAFTLNILLKWSLMQYSMSPCLSNIIYLL